MARLKRIQPPPQFTLGLTELERQGYQATCARMQRIAAERGNDAGCSKKGPGCSAPGPVGWGSQTG